ncbi:MAG: glycosyltransferase [Hyphomicrobium sp.]
MGRTVEAQRGEPRGRRIRPVGTGGAGPLPARGRGGETFPNDLIGLEPAGGTPDGQRLGLAVNRLRLMYPEFSASRLVTPGQRRVLTAVAVAGLGLAVLTPGTLRDMVPILLAVPFSFIVVLRLAALWHLAARAAGNPAGQWVCATNGAEAPGPESHWPRYSVLIPLYHEAAVAPALLAALAALDYPPAKLEILLITEQDDGVTRAALDDAGLARNMAVIVVPPGAPQTKPRALNYALGFASGEMVAVYDAEDVPDPGQLKAAVMAFRAGGPNLACVQARLDIYNPADSFFTRQFTLEYAALFAAILPALQRFGLPLPLSGTSNHFPRAMLEEAGAWDPFNVTEDADLGMRLARLGKQVAMLSLTTWEEAPGSARPWFSQRVRWIKGWMQTYLVHMRAPLRLLSDIGPWAFCGFQMIFGGLILSALVHPLFYVAVAQQLLSGAWLAPPPPGWSAVLWGVCAFNVAASYIAGIALAGLAAAKHGRWWLLRSALGLPVYWLMMSAAAYAAVFELVRRPHHWSKTGHTGSGRETLD